MDAGKLIQGIVVSVCVILIGTALLWNFISVEGAFYKHHQDVRREAYESTKSFNDGKAQELAKLQYEYLKGDDDTKIAVAMRVRHETAGYDLTKLTPELKTFVETCRK